MKLRQFPVVIACSAGLAALPVRAEPVDVELVLAVDVSGSMNGTELRLQRDGYIAAFRSPDVANAIAQGAWGKVAVTYLEWARNDLHRVIVPWRVIATPADAEAFAAALAFAPVDNMRNTSITGALARAAEEIVTNGFDGERKVIDISGDGPNNQGGLVTMARDAAIGQGITINGLPLMVEPWLSGRFGGFADLAAYYAACVTGGPLSFVVPVASWEEFPAAVRRKLVLELSGLTPDDEALPVVPVQFGDDRPVDCEIGEKLRRANEW